MIFNGDYKPTNITGGHHLIDPQLGGHMLGEQMSRNTFSRTPPVTRGGTPLKQELRTPINISKLFGELRGIILKDLSNIIWIRTSR